MKLIIEPLPFKELELNDHMRRVMFYDPRPLYAFMGHRINHFQRNPSVSVTDLFPSTGTGVCPCGCNQKITGRRTRYASEACSNFVGSIQGIISGHTGNIRPYLKRYYGWKCQQCGSDDKGHKCGYNGTIAWIKIDHIIPVKLGGGGCWLNNYQLVCHDCHVGKTNKDFGWGEHKVIEKAALPELPFGQ